MRQLNNLDLRIFSRESVNPHSFVYWKNYLCDYLAEICRSDRMFQNDWLVMWLSLTVFLTHTVDDIPLSRPISYTRPVVGTAVGSTIESELPRVFFGMIFGPVIEKMSCFLPSKSIRNRVLRRRTEKNEEKLAKQIKSLHEEVVYLR